MVAELEIMRTIVHLSMVHCNLCSREANMRVSSRCEERTKREQWPNEQSQNMPSLLIGCWICGRPPIALEGRSLDLGGGAGLGGGRNIADVGVGGVDTVSTDSAEAVEKVALIWLAGVIDMEMESSFMDAIEGSGTSNASKRNLKSIP